MESCFQDELRTLWTNSHVLWDVQFTNHISSYDRFNFCQPNWRHNHYCLHGQHVYFWQRIIKHEKKYKDGSTMLQGQGPLLKCKFHKIKIEYLGMVIEEGKISMDTLKLKGIQEWPTLLLSSKVKALLGFGNCYHKFIRKSLDHLMSFWRKTGNLNGWLNAKNLSVS